MSSLSTRIISRSEQKRFDEPRLKYVQDVKGVAQHVEPAQLIRMRMKWSTISFLTASLLAAVTSSLDLQLPHPHPPCSPGFFPANSTAKAACVCNNGSFDSMLICSANKTAYISSQKQWIGNVSGVIVMGVADYIHRETDKQYLYLPTEWEELNEKICGSINRKGVLCGSCVEGYGPSKAHMYKCVKCNEGSEVTNWLLYIALEYLPLTIFFVILLLFDVRVTSGLGNALIFYAQMTTTAFTIEDDNIFPLGYTASVVISAIYRLPYNMWNLEFLSYYVPPYCLSPHLDSYSIMALDYAVAVYPMILIIVFSFFLYLYDRGCVPIIYLCYPLRRLLNWVEKKTQLRRSIIGVFTTFIIISYTQFVFTAITIFTTNHLYNKEGAYASGAIPFYKGDTKFSAPSMVFFVSLSAVVLTVFGFLLPLLLIYPSVIQFLHRRTKWEWLVRLVPYGKFQEFLQGFHGCYKDGSNFDGDFRWFSGIFLLLRVIFYFIFSFTDTAMTQNTVMATLCFFLILLITIMKPFKRTIDNTVNVGVLSLLGMIAVLQMFNTHLIDYDMEISMEVYATQYILILVPLLAIGGPLCDEVLQDHC